MTPMTIHEAVKALRLGRTPEETMTQQDLAVSLGMSVSAISRFERETYRMLSTPSLQALKALAKKRGREDLMRVFDAALRREFGLGEDFLEIARSNIGNIHTGVDWEQLEPYVYALAVKLEMDEDGAFEQKLRELLEMKTYKPKQGRKPHGAKKSGR